MSGALRALAGRLARRATPLARRAGVEVKRWVPRYDDVGRRVMLLRHHGVDCVWDVGANAGQYGQLLRAAGYDGRIVSFEPLSSAFERLAARAASDPAWSCHPLGFGDVAGRFELHVAANSQSSSLLPMLALHREAAPHAHYIGKETVRIETLDAWCAAHPELLGARTFLKLDAQGYEARILAGGAATMHRWTGLQMEMSLAALYEGESLLPDLLRDAEAHGFRLESLELGFVDPQTGRQLQADGVFFRAPTG
ncbi:MAG: FkbM family methyltransferase [Deltaproteobacteria bacterium]|nr:FkbM family methyltransferase [Deltaproteobacteria bacterium]